MSSSKISKTITTTTILQQQLQALLHQEPQWEPKPTILQQQLQPRQPPTTPRTKMGTKAHANIDSDLLISPKKHSRELRSTRSTNCSCQTGTQDRQTDNHFPFLTHPRIYLALLMIAQRGVKQPVQCLHLIPSQPQLFHIRLQSMMPPYPKPSNYAKSQSSARDRRAMSIVLQNLTTLRSILFYYWIGTP